MHGVVQATQVPVVVRYVFVAQSVQLLVLLHDRQLAEHAEQEVPDA